MDLAVIELQCANLLRFEYKKTVESWLSTFNCFLFTSFIFFDQYEPITTVLNIIQILRRINRITGNIQT